MDFFHQLVLLQGFILSYLEFSKGLFFFYFFFKFIDFSGGKLYFFSAVIVLVASSEGNG